MYYKQSACNRVRFIVVYFPVFSLSSLNHSPWTNDYNNQYVDSRRIVGNTLTSFDSFIIMLVSMTCPSFDDSHMRFTNSPPSRMFPVSS